MAIDLQRITNSRLGVKLVSLIGKTVPPKMGYWIADFLAGWIATRRQSSLVRGIRINQWVIRGAGPDKETLDQAVQDTLKNIARALYSLYHFIHDPKSFHDKVVLNPVARGLLERPEFSDRGLMVVGVHMSNFDFILQSMCMQGMKAFALTIPHPQGGNRLEYEMRKRTGLKLVPASISAIRQAVKHLELGGMVLTGIDRPVTDSKFHPVFFGKASSLPTHHIHLAMKAGVPVVIVAARLGTDGRYHVTTSEPIEMESGSDHSKEILWNAERVLKEAEVFISQAPEQWSMTLPVWPHLMETVPG
jgi:lauroyl/myristoyl acyltransferase